jgi:iron-sulfur cluster repair protein YtfE (RIC family)
MGDVRIRKEMVVADLLTKHPQADEVMRRFSINPDTIDIHKTLDELCAQHDVDVDELIDTLNDILDEDYSAFSDQDEDE